MSALTEVWLTLTGQISVLLVSLGVIIATLSRPVLPSSASTDQDRAADARTYATGIGLLATSLFLSGVLGVLQEKTYKQYGGHWREGVFYTVRPVMDSGSKPIRDYPFTKIFVDSTLLRSQSFFFSSPTSSEG